MNKSSLHQIFPSVCVSNWIPSSPLPINFSLVNSKRSYLWKKGKTEEVTIGIFWLQYQSKKVILIIDFILTTILKFHSFLHPIFYFTFLSSNSPNKYFWVVSFHHKSFGLFLLQVNILTYDFELSSLEDNQMNKLFFINFTVGLNLSNSRNDDSISIWFNRNPTSNDQSCTSSNERADHTTTL